MFVGLTWQKGIQFMGENFVKERRDSCLGSHDRVKVFYSTLEMHGDLLDLDKMNSGECPAYTRTYSSLLRTCIEQKALTDGKRIHDHMTLNGCEPNLLLGNLLLDMYVTCGCMWDAERLFDTLFQRNLCTWAFLFKGYADHGQWEESLALFWKMWGEGVMPNSYIYAIVLQACANLLNVCGGKEVHACIVKSGCKVTKVLASALVSMYTKCGSLDDAQLVFDKVPSRNVVLWSALLAGYAHCGQADVAIVLFWQMQIDDGVEPNEVVCVSILKACAKIRAHNEGRKVHDCIVRNSFDVRLSVSNTLIDMYTKCGCLKDACSVFDKIAQPDVVSWSALIAGYGERGNGLDPFKLLSVMESKGIYVNEVTFLNLLKGCTSIEYLDNARVIHTHIIARGLTLNGCLENNLVDVYAKCGKLEDANYIFEKLSARNVVSWSALIMGHAHNGLHKEALMLFYQMQEDVRPNATTFVSILKVSAGLQSLEVGKRVHFGISEHGLETELFVGSALVDMYAKCGAVEDARRVFDNMPKRNIVAWSSIIACYAQQETAEEAVKLFWLMQREGVKPDDITFVSILKACTICAMLEQGKHIHKYALNMGNKFSFFLGSTLVDMYTRCGSIDDARRVFAEITQKDAALWNALVIGYGQHGLALDAFGLLCQMEQQGMELNHVTYVGLLSACSHAGLLEEGLQVFDSIKRDHRTTEHCVCVVDLLGRAGCLRQAVAFVQQMPCQPDATIWLSLVGACRLSLDLKLATAGVESLLEIEPENAVAYVLLSNIVYEAD